MDMFRLYRGGRPAGLCAAYQVQTTETMGYINELGTCSAPISKQDIYGLCSGSHTIPMSTGQQQSRGGGRAMAWSGAVVQQMKLIFMLLVYIS
jgi:hypothetical protein